MANEAINVAAARRSWAKDAESASQAWLPLAAILALALALRLFYFGGVVGSDDSSLAESALSILRDGFQTPQSHYAIRIGLTLPLAGIFAVAGVGDWQLALIPLAWSLVGIWAAWSIAAHVAGRPAGLLAALALAVFPLDVYLATRLFPDVPLGASCGAAVALMLRARDADRPYPAAIAAGLLWGYAYLVRIEAGLLLFVLLFLWAQKPSAWRPLFVVGLSCGTIFLAENLYYWADTGRLLHHLWVDVGESQRMVKGASYDPDYNKGEFWTFFKAWFITPYEFGLHYYLLFAGFVWIFVTRRRPLYFLVLWAGLALLWLQFGGNPFSDNYSIKSHLPRYCAMLSVPMAAIVGALLASLPRAPRIVAVGLTVVVGLFMMNFNSLSGEREAATKLALRAALANGWFPLWMDFGSYTIAELELWGRPEAERIHNLQAHNFKTGETKLVELEEAEGYVMLNEALMRFRQRRYGVESEDADDLAGRELKLSVDNPMGSAAYAQARLMSAAAGLIPVPFLRDKIQHTADELLEGRDVVIYGPRR